MIINKKLRLPLIEWLKVYLGTTNYDIMEPISNNISGCIFPQATSVINLIEASIYRMNKAAASVGNYTANSYRLSSYIEERKDKQVGTLRTNIQQWN